MRAAGIVKRFLKTKQRLTSIKTPPNAKVTVCGNSLLAQMILLDLKLSPLLKEIRIFDAKPFAKKMADDLNSVETPSVVKPYYGNYQMGLALQDTDVVVIATGYYGVPGEPKSSIFKKNLPALLDLAYECAHYNPKAAVVVLTPPGTRNVPLISELYSKLGLKESGQIMAPMSQHEMRAAKLVAQALKLPAGCISLPVVGGCCPDTVIPVFSHATPQNEFTQRDMENILDALRVAAENVAIGQRGRPPSLAPAMAASRLVLDIIRGRFGMSQPPQSVFLKSDVLLNVKYLGTPVVFGPDGVQKNVSMPSLSEKEMKLLAEVVSRLQEDARLAEAAACAEWGKLDS